MLQAKRHLDRLEGMYGTPEADLQDRDSTEHHDSHERRIVTDLLRVRMCLSFIVADVVVWLLLVLDWGKGEMGGTVGREEEATFNCCGSFLPTCALYFILFFTAL